MKIKYLDLDGKNVYEEEVTRIQISKGFQGNKAHAFIRNTKGDTITFVGDQVANNIIEITDDREDLAPYIKHIGTIDTVMI